VRDDVVHKNRKYTTYRNDARERPRWLVSTPHQTRAGKKPRFLRNVLKVFLRDLKVFCTKTEHEKYDPNANGLSKHRTLLKTKISSGKGEEPIWKIMMKLMNLTNYN